MNRVELATGTIRHADRATVDVGLRADRRLVVGFLLGTLVVALAYGSFLLPLLADGLASGPQASAGTPSDLRPDLVVGAHLDLPRSVLRFVVLGWMATVALAPLVGLSGMVVGGALGVALLRDRRPGLSAVALSVVVIGAALTALALSPWGRTASAILFD